MRKNHLTQPTEHEQMIYLFHLDLKSGSISQTGKKVEILKKKNMKSPYPLLGRKIHYTICQRKIFRKLAKKFYFGQTWMEATSLCALITITP